MFGPKKSPEQKSILREQQRQTSELKKQTRLMSQQHKSAGGQGGGLLGDMGKMLGAVGGAIAETVSELQDDYRSHRTQVTESQRRQHEQSQLGHLGHEGGPADETHYLPPTGPTNPLTHSSVWGQLTAPGAPKVRFDSYFHSTDEKDLATYLKDLAAENRFPFTATMLTLNLTGGEQGATHLATFARTLSAYPNVYGSVGYGPRNLMTDIEELDTHLTNLLNTDAKLLAIGPIGLDMVYAPHTLPQQILQLERQLAIAADFGLPVYLMNRSAATQLSDVFKNLPFKPPAIIYTKPIRTPEEVALIKQIDAHILLRAEFTWPEEKAYHQAVIQDIPRQRWLLASGNGLTAGHSRRGQTNSPLTLNEVETTAHNLLNLPNIDLLALLNTNTHRLFLR